MTVLIENLQKEITVTDNTKELLNKAAEESLLMEDFSIPCEISIMLVDNESIREINREYRGYDKPTDVLSFPMLEGKNGKLKTEQGDFDMEKKLLLLGDIVISLEMAAKQAEEYGHSFERELAFLTTHGMFHLLGYDHENENDAGIMFDKQETVLLHMGLQRSNASEE